MKATLTIYTTNKKKFKKMLYDSRPIYDGTGTNQFTDFRHACLNALAYNTEVVSALDDESLVSPFDSKKGILVDLDNPPKKVLVDQLNGYQNPNKFIKSILEVNPTVFDRNKRFIRDMINKQSSKATFKIVFTVESDDIRNNVLSA